SSVGAYSTIVLTGDVNPVFLSMQPFLVTKRDGSGHQLTIMTSSFSSMLTSESRSFNPPTGAGTVCVRALLREYLNIPAAVRYIKRRYQRTSVTNARDA